MSIRKDIEIMRNEMEEWLRKLRTSQRWLVVMPAGSPVTFEMHADGDEPLRYENPQLLGWNRWTHLSQHEAEAEASRIFDGGGYGARAMKVSDYLIMKIREADHVLTLLPSDELDN